ncbi:MULTISPECIES: hypothetical protein [Enterobacteriaceae]|uniref:hypothetical protein n=1 Tax=Enterobacteriaceae TaxID=543 RepID=UPI0005EDD425|nr:hypothetical protein [Enterobacter hormaechei]KJM73080.1 hypothetical protein SS28_12455 [Enterobacter hormaechei subsp. steigerwaltii]VAF16704.1 Uncharacterised protein [Enterobacter hormaechei]
MAKSKSQSDLGIFVIGWLASTLAVGVPTIFLIVFKKYYPDTPSNYDDKVSIIAYLIGAFFSGLFTTYRVVCKSKEKDNEIEERDNKINELEKDIEDAKKAYRSLSPKSKIISILVDIHSASYDLSKKEIMKSLMRKVKEINNDSTFEPRYDGMIIYVADSDYKKEIHSNNNANTKKINYSNIRMDQQYAFKTV